MFSPDREERAVEPAPPRTLSELLDAAEITVDEEPMFPGPFVRTAIIAGGTIVAGFVIAAAVFLGSIAARLLL